MTGGTSSQGTQKEKASGEGASASCWSGGYEQRAVVKVSQREERAKRMKAFLVFPIAVLYLAIMSGCVRTDQLMLDTQLGSGFLKKDLDISFTGRVICW